MGCSWRVEKREQSRNFTQNHFAKLVVVNFPIVVGVCLSNHLFHFFVGEPFAKVHHAVLELLLADVTVTVPIEHPKSKKGWKTVNPVLWKASTEGFIVILSAHEWHVQLWLSSVYHDNQSTIKTRTPNWANDELVLTWKIASGLACQRNLIPRLVLISLKNGVMFTVSWYFWFR